MQYVCTHLYIFYIAKMMYNCPTLSGQKWHMLQDILDIHLISYINMLCMLKKYKTPMYTHSCTCLFLKNKNIQVHGLYSCARQK